MHQQDGESDVLARFAVLGKQLANVRQAIAFVLAGDVDKRVLQRHSHSVWLACEVEEGVLDLGCFVEAVVRGPGVEKGHGLAGLCAASSAVTEGDGGASVASICDGSQPR